MSTLFLRTLREDPADAEVPSHKLLVRGGYVRRVAPGIYSWLPLGLRVLRAVEDVVREEMVGIGAQEVHFPALIPREPYETSGRWTEYGDGVFRLKDRKDADYMLGPTHEELFTLLVKSEYSSYKDLPVSLFQIQTKYRDEARPRAGILRGREFVMKDSYSFDLDDEGLQRSYDAHRAAYVRIFERLGLDVRIVAATSGAMGGSASEEFLAVTATGEDTFASTADGYAANVEKLQLRGPAECDPSAHPAMEVVDTPHAPTIAALVEHFRGLGADVGPEHTLKNVVLTLTSPDGTTETLVVGVPGDREVDLKRLEAHVAPATVAPAEVDQVPGLVKGYIGPVGLPKGIRYVVDELVVRGSAWITGANAPGKHARHVVLGRDFEAAGVVGAVEVREGDLCTGGEGPIRLERGIEMGHVFQLGRKYADAFGLDVLGPVGKPVRVTMGSYGVGVSRAVAAVVEQSHDDKGIVWPRSIAPADVHVLAVGKGDEQKQVALRLAEELEGHGLRVLLDDRGASPGVAFRDYELIGVPTGLVCGRSLADGLVEIRDRRSGSSTTVALEEAVTAVLAEVRS
jgi:prolyl-tRNA synthetase